MLFFFFNDTATTEIYTLSLHDALPISIGDAKCQPKVKEALASYFAKNRDALSDESKERLERNPLRILDSKDPKDRSEEHTSELQSQSNLVCRLLLEKKKKDKKRRIDTR